MNELDNLVQIQQTVNNDSDLRLPILEITNSGYYPATLKDMAIIKQEIIQRARASLPKENIYIRQKNLFDLNERNPIEKIPPWLFREFFKSHKIKWETNERQEIQQKNGFMKYKNVRRFIDDTVDLEILSSEIQNIFITKTIIDNDLIPELFWKNELGGPDAYTPEMPILDSITMDYAKNEFSRWRDWMLKNEVEQWNLFEYMLNLFCFANHKKDADRKICVGVGKNGGGKGSMIKMLECIPNCRKPDQFGATALTAEYRSFEAFKIGSTLSVCHEFPLITKVPAEAIGLIKSATRGEMLAVRNVREASREIRFWGGLVLFSNSNAERKMAVNAAQRYFSEWLAYDRFNIVHCDWFFNYPRANQLRTIFNDTESKVAQAFGVCLWNHAEEIKTNPIPFYPIPDSFKAEGAGEFTIRYHAWLENLIEAWGEFHNNLDNLIFEGQYPAIEEQQKLAVIQFSPLFREKSLLSKEFQITEKTDHGIRIKAIISASTVTQCIQKMGGNRKWQIPPGIEKYLKTTIEGRARIRSIAFDGTQYAIDNASENL